MQLGIGLAGRNTLSSLFHYFNFLIRHVPAPVTSSLVQLRVQAMDLCNPKEGVDQLTETTDQLSVYHKERWLADQNRIADKAIASQEDPEQVLLLRQVKSSQVRETAVICEVRAGL